MLIGLAAYGIRVYAIDRLPADYDEDDYLRAAQLIADGLRTGDTAIALASNYRPEHPPLQKLLFALAILPLGERPDIPDADTSALPNQNLPADYLRAARLVSGALGALQTALLALVNPFAAAAVAVNSFHVKYTSQAMLEALPSAASLACALAWMAWRRGGRGRGAWLAMSGAALGVTAASKYLYCLVGIAIVAESAPDVASRLRTGGLRGTLGALSPLAAWGLIALVTFFLADPYLWPDPAGRLRSSILYHAAYSTGADVQRVNYPFWQPFVWLSGSVAWERRAFLFSIDLLQTGLALAGLGRVWRRQRLMALWLAIGMAFLLAWNTKWPQYILVIAVPWSVAAAEGFTALVADPWRRRRAAGASRASGGRPATLQDGLRAAPWLLPGSLALLALAGAPMVYQLLTAMTDLSATSLRDGVAGGVFRAVLGGLVGQAPPSNLSLYELSYAGDWRSPEVRYTGLTLIGEVFSGAFAFQTWFSVMWAALSVSLSATLGVGVALILNRAGLRFAGAWRAFFVIPWAIPEFLSGVVWARLAEPDHGWLALALGQPLPFLESWAGLLLVQSLAGMWMGFPIVMLTATAALQLIPSEVYDGAAMDGATGWALLRHVTLPLILPLVTPALIVRAVFAFNQFYLFMPLGGGNTLASLAYQLSQPRVGASFGRAGGLYSVSAAIDVFIVAVLMVGVYALSRRTKAAEGVTYA